MIYFAAPVGVPDLVKIGFTGGDVAKRVSDLQTASPFPLSIAGTHEGDRRREKMLHAIFQEHRSVGEWFNVDPSEVARVNLLIDADRMTAMLKLRPRQFEKLSRLLGTTSIRETFVLGLQVDGLESLIAEATARPTPTPKRPLVDGKRRPGPVPRGGKCPMRSIRVPNDEWDLWKETAAANNLSLSAWIRQICNEEVAA